MSAPVLAICCECHELIHAGQAYVHRLISDDYAHTDCDLLSKAICPECLGPLNESWCEHCECMVEEVAS